MSSASSSKSKPKKSSNLRIMWIPGRKKHNRKGACNPTKNGVPQTYGMTPRKNESWTLGGTLNQSKIINADLHENNLDVASMAAGGVMGLAAMGTTTGTIGANGVPVCDPQQQQDHDRLQADPMPSTSQAVGTIGSGTQPQIVIGTIELNNLNGDAVNNKEKEISTSNQFELTLIDEDDEEEKDRNCSNAHSSSSLLSSNNDNRSAEENNVHNAATLSIGEQHRRRGRRRSSQKDRRSAEDIDSIDQADSAVDVLHGEEPNVFEEDVVQHRAAGVQEEPMVLRKRKNRRLSQRRRTSAQTEQESDIVEDEEKKEPYDKAVTCLYWSLACWDCNIS